MTSRIRLSRLISPGLYDVHRAVRSGKVDEIVLAGGRGSTRAAAPASSCFCCFCSIPTAHAAVLRKVGNTLRNSVFEQIALGGGRTGPFLPL